MLSAPFNLPNGFGQVQLGCYVAAAIQYLRVLFINDQTSYHFPKDSLSHVLRQLYEKIRNGKLSSSQYSFFIEELSKKIKLPLQNLGDSMEVVSIVLKRLEEEKSELCNLFTLNIESCECQQKKVKTYGMLPVNADLFMNWQSNLQEVLSTTCNFCKTKKYQILNNPKIIFIHFISNGCDCSISTNSFLKQVDTTVEILPNSHYKPFSLVDSSGGHAIAIVKYISSWFIVDSLSSKSKLLSNQMSSYIIMNRKYTFKGISLTCNNHSQYQDPSFYHNEIADTQAEEIQPVIDEIADLFRERVGKCFSFLHVCFENSFDYTDYYTQDQNITSTDLCLTLNCLLEKICKDHSFLSNAFTWEFACNCNNEKKLYMPITNCSNFEDISQQLQESILSECSLCHTVPTIKHLPNYLISTVPDKIYYFDSLSRKHSIGISLPLNNEAERVQYQAKSMLLGSYGHENYSCTINYRITSWESLTQSLPANCPVVKAILFKKK